MKKIILDNSPPIIPSEGKYTLYIRAAGANSTFYLCLMKSDDYEMLCEKINRINDARILMKKNRKNKELE